MLCYSAIFNWFLLLTILSLIVIIRKVFKLKILVHINVLQNLVLCLLLKTLRRWIQKVAVGPKVWKSLRIHDSLIYVNCSLSLDLIINHIVRDLGWLSQVEGTDLVKSWFALVYVPWGRHLFIILIEDVLRRRSIKVVQPRWSHLLGPRIIHWSHLEKSIVGVVISRLARALWSQECDVAIPWQSLHVHQHLSLWCNLLVLIPFILWILMNGVHLHRLTWPSTRWSCINLLVPRHSSSLIVDNLTAFKALLNITSPLSSTNLNLLTCLSLPLLLSILLLVAAIVQIE
jgi:hypothetical protein